jgi:hypothetical protein
VCRKCVVMGCPPLLSLAVTCCSTSISVVIPEGG